MRQDEDGETVFYDKLDITCLWNGTYDKNPSVVSQLLNASVSQKEISKSILDRPLCLEAVPHPSPTEGTQPRIGLCRPAG